VSERTPGLGLAVYRARYELLATIGAVLDEWEAAALSELHESYAEFRDSLAKTREAAERFATARGAVGCFGALGPAVSEWVRRP
jgi:hypothetical protein